MALAASSQAADYQLKATPNNIVWGYYWAGAKPVLHIRSGDTVTIGKARPAFRIPQTLPSPPDAAEPAGYLGASRIPSCYRMGASQAGSGQAGSGQAA